jgi:hypothetical protein
MGRSSEPGKWAIWSWKAILTVSAFKNRLPFTPTPSLMAMDSSLT